MADALVSVVLEQLFSIIQLEIGQEVRLVVGVRKEVKKLTATFTVIQAVLKDAEEKQVKNEAVKIWLEHLQDISYDADDLLDEWNTRILVSQMQRLDENAATILNKVRSSLFSPFSCCKPVVLRHDIAQRIKDIRERLDEVAKEKDEYNFIENPSLKEVTRPVTSSFIDVSEIYGRVDDTKTIMSKLLSENSHQDVDVPVIAIVGTGDFGKTTLAQLILHEKQVVAHFEKTMWVCVSEPFDLQKVAKEIIEEANEVVPNTVGWQALHKSLCDAVKGKLFLLVLDDVWTYDDKIWRQLKHSLDGGAPGSRIIVTTRDERVAKMMCATYICRLEQLSDDDCWSLFRCIAFRGRNNDFGELEDIGKKISQKCRGVPLAARILASLMCLKQSKRDWMDVLESDLWELMSEDVNGFLPELFLSYYALPSHLKPCLLYCAILKKDVEIEKDELVKLWMAQGFVSSDGRKVLEKIGADYFDNLAMRSFFQNFRKDDEGKIVVCKMHDLVHDFAQFLAKCNSSNLDMNDQDFSCVQGRHLSTSSLENPSIYKLKSLRTLRPCDGKWIGTIPFELFHQLTCLRALDLHSSDLEELPVEVERLIHLRYLNLSNTMLMELPDTICDLHNLQTLKLNGCSHLRKLPDRIGKLSNLRHLEIGGGSALSYLPRSLGRLCQLRTLSKFIVGGETGGCKFEDLKLLNHLQGSLTISVFEQAINIDEVAEAELNQKKNIRGLELLFKEVHTEQDVKRMEIVLNGLQPHLDLQRLGIKFYPGRQFPFWISLFSNLVHLVLYGCKECLELPCLGKLSSLEDLYLFSLSSVKRIGHEFYGLDAGISNTNGDITLFPKLGRLEIFGMTELEEWEIPVSKDRNIMPCLSVLSLKNCEKLRVFPALGTLESLESLTIWGMSLVKHVGLEFLGTPSGDDGHYSGFPKLKDLEFREMENWEVWDMMPLQKGEQEVFPNLVRLFLCNCTGLRVLPAFGRLNSLETLILDQLDGVKQVGLEFLGMSDFADDDDDCTSRLVVFPKLKLLHFDHMGGWEEWNLPFPNKNKEFLPHLCQLKLTFCTRLRALPALGKLKSLQILVLRKLSKVESLCVDLFGISSDNGSAEEGEPVSVEVFPRLTCLKLMAMDEWEEKEKINLVGKDQGLTSIMPCLSKLEIVGCPKLKVVPQYMFSHALRYLVIGSCPKLTGIQPCLPLFLEELHLMDDAGVFMSSLPISRCLGHSYPNLNLLRIISSPHSLLPEGFSQFTAIQKLFIFDCKFLEFTPEDLKHLTKLQNLEIHHSPILSAHWVEEVCSRTRFHIPKIIIDFHEISFGLVKEQ